MVKHFLKAVDAGFTAFFDSLALPLYGFPLLADPADALEDDEIVELWKNGELKVVGCDACQCDSSTVLAASEDKSRLESSPAAPGGQPEAWMADRIATLEQQLQGWRDWYQDYRDGNWPHVLGLPCNPLIFQYIEELQDKNAALQSATQ